MARLASGLILVLALSGAAEGSEDERVLVRATLRSVTDGKPLAHFPLRVVNSKLQAAGKDLEIQTDAVGRLSLPVSTSTTIESRKDGWSLGVVCVPELLKRPELVAWPVGEVEVRLRWKGKGPAPDWPRAKVNLTPVWGLVLQPVAQRSGWTSTARRPSPDGVLRTKLPLLGRLSVRVTATDAKLVQQVLELPEVDAHGSRRLEITLEPRQALWIHGRVVGPGGERVDGATVWVTVPGRAPSPAERKLSLRQRLHVPRRLLDGVENDVGSGDGLPQAARWGRSGYDITTRDGGRFAFGIDEPTQDVHLVAYVEGHSPVSKKLRIVRAEEEGHELRLGSPVEPVKVRIRASEVPDGARRLRVQELSPWGAGPTWSVSLEDGGIATTSWLVDGRKYRMTLSVRDRLKRVESHAADVFWQGQKEIQLAPSR